MNASKFQIFRRPTRRVWTLGLVALCSMTCAGSAVFAKEKLSISVTPQPLIAGEKAQLNLVFSGDEVPEIVDLPDINGINWVGRLQPRVRERVVNFHVTRTTQVSYAFVPERVGTYAIPPLKVKIGDDEVTTGSFKIKARKRTFSVGGDGGGDLEDLLFTKLKVHKSGDKAYVGEQIPVEIQVFAINGLEMKLFWPEIEIEHVIFRDFSDVNKKNADFAGFREFSKTIDGRSFNVTSFLTSFRPIAVSELTGRIVVNCEIRIPRRRGDRRLRSFFGDSFFDDGFSRYDAITRQINVPFPALSVEALPERPEDANYLGLVGYWSVTTDVSAAEYKVGEPITLELRIEGHGTLDTLKAPTLNMPGFRVYPPEIDKEPAEFGEREKALIKYLMIPLRDGDVRVDLKPAVFDCAEGKYRTFPFDKKFNVEKSDDPNALNSVYLDARRVEEETAKRKAERKKRQSSGILYLKKDKAGEVSVPLWQNHWPWSLGFLLFGPLILLIGEITHFRRGHFSRNPHLMRRRAAQARRSRVLRSLRTCDDEDVNVIAQKEVIPYLNDLLDMPPGTDAAGLADEIDDEELGKCLRELSKSSYMPGLRGMGQAELRGKLHKGLKRVFVIILSAVALCLASETFAEVVSRKVNNNDEALIAYDNGDLKAAATYYRDQINPAAPDPAMLYNLGNCLFKLGDLPRALVSYERALRLAPRDSDILENLNFTRRKLFLPEIRQIKHPLDLLLNLRNSFRPDQWTLAACLAWALLFLAVAFRRSIGKKWRFLTVILAVVFGVFTVAAVSEWKTTYSDEVAIVVVNNTPVYSLPSEKNGRVEFKLKAGEEVHIEERRSNWIRTRADEAEGWVRGNTISRLWLIPDAD